jgi:hypothetical protein
MEKDDKRQELEDKLAGYLKGALKQGGVTYEGLAVELKAHGFPEETKASIASKLARGSFSAAFLVAALRVAGRAEIRLGDV